MIKSDTLAFDNKSARNIDDNGFLHVTECNISKATVNPYRGNTIPNWEHLGLEPDRIYMLYRDPLELERAATTFNEKPLLNDHIVVDSTDVPKRNIAGTIGSNTYFEFPYLKASLTVWDAGDISLIEANKKKELSCSYRYRADMTSGEIDSVHYDGVMRDIIGNHVAIVERGRAGSDVVVADHDDINLNKKGKFTMKYQSLKQRFQGLFASDASEEEIDKALDEAVEEAKKAEDESVEVKKETEIKKADDMKAKDEELKAKDAEIEQLKKELAAKTLGANDALDPAVIRQQVLAEVNAVNQAKNAVHQFVGNVALDSADDVYAYALGKFGVNTSELKGAALKATFDAVAGVKNQSLAQDSALPKGNADLDSLFKTKRL